MDTTMSEPNEHMEFDPEGAEVVERKDITPSLSDDPRSLARRIALQVLYQVDGGNQTVDIAMRYHLVLDDMTGKVIDIDEDMAGIVVGDFKALAPDSPLSQRIHLYNVYFDPGGRLRAGQKADEVARLTRTVTYLVAEAHAQRLAIGVSEKQDDLDDVLQDYAPDFPIQQVAVIDRNILRMALYELAIISDEPVSAIINEAVELANLFGAEGSARFVNGVLGTVAQQLDDVKADLRGEARPGSKPKPPIDDDDDPNDDGYDDEDDDEDADSAYEDDDDYDDDDEDDDDYDDDED
jgi:transcription antitermination protein NusB